MAMKAADLLAAASGKTSNIVLGLGQSAEVDALVKDLRIGDRHSRMEMKRLLTAGKITSNTKDDHGCPLLLAACQGGMASLAYDMITSWKADANALDELNNNCLHMCQFYGGGEWQVMQNTLEQAYCDDTALNSMGLRPSEMTHDAIVTKIFDLLAEDVADKSKMEAATNNVGDRKRGEDVTIKTLTRKFMTGHERDVHSRTLLMLAAAAGSMDLVKYMLTGKMKGDKDALDADGNTALHHAVRNHQEFIAAFIVRKGADTRTRNNAGKTAMQIRSDAQADLAQVDTDKKENKKQAPKELSALDRLEEEQSPEMEQLHAKFLKAANSEAALGLANARTGRVKTTTLPALGDERLPAKSLARNQTLNYSEFLVFLRGEGLMPLPFSLTLASDVFRRVAKELAHEEGFEPGEMHWIHFKQCLCYLVDKAQLPSISGVPREQLVPVAPMRSKKKSEWDKWNISEHTKEILQRDMTWMQRQLFIMADRAKETTSLRYLFVGRVNYSPCAVDIMLTLFFFRS